MTKNRIAAMAGGVAASLAVLIGAYDVSAATSATSADASTTSSTSSTQTSSSGTSVTSVSSGGTAQATTAGS